MAKVHGNIRKNDKKNDRQPDLRGSIKVGGWTGQRADEKNRDAAQWLKNLASEFGENKETYISVAIWKRIDQETEQPYFSMTLEDNSWRNSNNSVGPEKKSSPKSESKNQSEAKEEAADDIMF